ncbi:kelch-like protein 7, partial [Antrostomus carolinensis]|uniref:kelch-like protein 7 n=1 Tax=Antrostomus carolinensis TaxID=279965 RepID=UPI0010A993B5
LQPEGSQKVLVLNFNQELFSEQPDWTPVNSVGTAKLQQEEGDDWNHGSKTLCDVVLMVQERKIPAHRVVLASASHFFNLMFTTNMLESKSFEVELKDAEPDIIEQLVEFAYTARISVNSNNVQSLLDAANQYQIEPVKKMCVDFLKEQVDASNCLGISVLAECLDCPELKATADDFIHQHFTEVYKTDEFLQLDVKRVTHLLNQDTLTVRAEDQ